MIFNATLLRLDTPALSAAGDRAFAPGTTISVRVCLDEPTSQQRWQIDEAQLSATAVLYVPMADLAAISAPAPAADMQALVELDGDTASVLYRIERVKSRRQAPTSHYECFLRVA